MRSTLDSSRVVLPTLSLTDVMKRYGATMMLIAACVHGMCTKIVDTIAAMCALLVCR